MRNFSLMNLVFGALALCAACGTESPHSHPADRPTLDDANYSSVCSAAADCVLVGVGTCGDCGFCVPAAINRSDLTAYNDDVTAADCHSPVQCFAPCIRSQPFSCVAGACTVAP